MSLGGIMFFSSTRLTLMPQLSVASSQDGPHLGVDVVAAGEGLVQLQVADDVPQGGGGQILNGPHGVLHAVGVQTGDR